MRLSNQNTQQTPFKTEINTIIQKVVAVKGWTELYNKLRSSEVYSPVILYKMIYRSNGNEELVQQKLINRKAKLQNKLKKNNLESQFEELSKIVEIGHPKMALRVLKHNGGNVALAAQKISTFSGIGSHKHRMMETLKTKNPQYQSIIEDLLSSGFIYPIPFYFRLLSTHQGDATQIKESLLQQSTQCSKSMNLHHHFRERCMKNMENGEFRRKKWMGKFDRSQSSSSPSSSSASSSDSELDNDKIKEYAKANFVLVENGFKNAQKNLRVLKENNCNTQAALKQLIRETLKKDSKIDHQSNRKCDTSSFKNCRGQNNNNCKNSGLGCDNYQSNKRDYTSSNQSSSRSQSKSTSHSRDHHYRKFFQDNHNNNKQNPQHHEQHHHSEFNHCPFLSIHNRIQRSKQEIQRCFKDKMQRMPHPFKKETGFKKASSLFSHHHNEQQNCSMPSHSSNLNENLNQGQSSKGIPHQHPFHNPQNHLNRMKVQFGQMKQIGQLLKKGFLQSLQVIKDEQKSKQAKDKELNQIISSSSLSFDDEDVEILNQIDKNSI